MRCGRIKRGLEGTMVLWGACRHPFMTGIITSTALVARAGNPLVFLQLPETRLEAQTPAGGVLFGLIGLFCRPEGFYILI